MKPTLVTKDGKFLVHFDIDDVTAKVLINLAHQRGEPVNSVAKHILCGWVEETWRKIQSQASQEEVIE